MQGELDRLVKKVPLLSIHKHYSIEFPDFSSSNSRRRVVVLVGFPSWKYNLWTKGERQTTEDLAMLRRRRLAVFVLLNLHIKGLGKEYVEELRIAVKDRKSAGTRQLCIAKCL